MSTLALHRLYPNASQLVYGCMGLGGGWNNNPISNDDIQQCHRIIDTVLTEKINVFDHADIYTFTKAETVFGNVLAERPELRSHMIIQSKCGIRFEDNTGPKRYDFSQAHITQSVDGILKRLNCDYLDLLLLHRPDPLMDPREIANTLSSLEKSGKVKHFGVSNMHLHQMQFLNHYLEKPLVVNQIEMSLSQLNWLNEGVLAGQHAGADVNFAAGTLEYCQTHDIQLQSWGSLSQGLFTGQDLSAQPHSIQSTANLVAQLASEYQCSKEAIVLAFIQRHPANIQPTIGTTSLDRITACAQAAQITLSREHWYQLFVTARGNELP